jgi:hypothetical protein|eukprot:COSAG06_NODE_1713_length_8629_cov_25.894842_4_plen_58_part_00
MNPNYVDELHALGSHSFLVIILSLSSIAQPGSDSAQSRAAAGGAEGNTSADCTTAMW